VYIVVLQGEELPVLSGWGRQEGFGGQLATFMAGQLHSAHLAVLLGVA
jgi:hypothetical protein